MASGTKSFSPEMIYTLNTEGGYSIKNVREELRNPILIDKENAVLSFKYSYIRKLIPVVLDLYKVDYNYWSNLFCNAVRDYNLLHHIDITVDGPSRSISIDAVVLSWIYATISPYLLVRLDSLLVYDTSAMHAWDCLRNICQKYNTTVQNKKRRFIYVEKDNFHDTNNRVDNDNYHDMNNRVDFISDLPDDMIVYVLSLVADMKTVGRTCILSKRWTHVWTYLGDLDFSDPETSGQMNLTCYAQPEMDKFVDRVNRVITANQATYLETFRINFPLSTSYDSHIHNWLKFVLDKQVRNLDLDFRATEYPSIDILNIYINPSLILNTTLKSLHLKSVAMKGPLLQWVLTNCLNLQRLSLHHCKASADDDAASSKQYKKLVVSSLRLKHLEFFCSLKLLNIDELHLSAPNLTSFILYDSEIRVEYRSVPSLVEATFDQQHSHQIFHDDLDSLSSFSSQLEKLSIRWYKVHSACSRFPTFVNIQQLEITAYPWDDDIFLSTSLMEACPLMHTFKLKLMSLQQLQWSRKSLAPKDAQIKAISSHQHLKVVEYIGYAGLKSAAALALFLTRHAPMLRRFVFDTRQPRHIGKPREVYTSDCRNKMDTVRKTTEMLAKQLQWRQNHVNVVIL